MSNFMFLLDAQKVGFADGFLRKIWAWICRGLYELVSGLLQTIFYLANFDILDLADEMMNRVYVIIGIFMLFKITISLLNYLVNPDKISDKEAGASKLISRVIISLCMLILLPGAFSIMTDLQNQLLPVLPRIIIGKDTANSGTKSTDLAEATADNMVITIVRGFTYPAVTDQGACTNVININTLDDFTDNIAEKCSPYDNYYALSNHGIISFIVAALMVYVTFSLAISTAIRAFKLIILRVIAPAPVLSYIDPKSSKGDGMFNKWIKMFISTWAELLVNLGIIYFIIFMIQKLFTNDNWMTYLSDAPGEGFIHGLVIAFIIIGLLMFAREAPKFIMDALGIKNSGGFGRMLGMGATALGGIGGTVSSIGSSVSRVGDDWKTGNHRRAIFGALGTPLSALSGGISALSSGGHALMTDKDGRILSGVDAQIKNNNSRIAAIRNGSTGFGRATSLGRQLLTGESSADAHERNIKNMEAQKGALEAVKSRVSSEMVKKDTTFGQLSDSDTWNTNYKSFMAEMETAKSQGLYRFGYHDTDGNLHYIDMADAEMQKGNLLKTNENNYIKQVNDGTIEDSTLTSYIETANKLGRTIKTRDDVNPEIDKLSTKIADAKVENSRRAANRRGSGNSN